MPVAIFISTTQCLVSRNEVLHFHHKFPPSMQKQNVQDFHLLLSPQIPFKFERQTSEGVPGLHKARNLGTDAGKLYN